MTTHKEALKLALEELAVRFSEGWHEGIKIDASDIMLLNKAAQALAQPEQEPVAFLVYDPRVQSQELYFDDELGDTDYCEITPLYTTPPQRTWVGLTPDEMLQCNLDEKGIMVSREQAKRNVEAKLKEKNS